MAKNIVICIDGTSSDVICDSTNVLRLFRCLLRSQHQTVYYDSGVGTVSDPSKLTWISKTISRKLDSAIGHSVRENVCRAYQFLVRSYEPVTESICLGSVAERMPCARWPAWFTF